MNLLNRIAAGTLAAGLTLVVGSASAQTELRISSASPPTGPLITAFQIIKERVEAAHPDAIKVTIHHSSSLFRQGTELPAMQRGNLEMATPIIYEIEQQMPAYGALGKPYVFRDAAHLLAVFNGEIGKRFAADVSRKMGVEILATGYFGTRTVGLRSVHNIKKPEDFAGVKLRMAPGAAYQHLASALGATPVSMPATEVYLGLSTGAIDGQDNPLNLVLNWKFNEVTKEFVMTNHLVQPVFYAVSSIAWKKLTPEQQATLRAAAQEGAAKQTEETLEQEAVARAQFEGEGIVFSDPDLAPFREKVDAVYRDQGLMRRWMPGLLDQVAAVR